MTKAFWQAPHIMQAKIWHKRHQPKVNDFTYSGYYLAFDARDVEALNLGPVRVNRAGLMRYDDADHGDKNGSPAHHWAEKWFQYFNIDPAGYTLTLITLPRVLGYVFNPVSFWLLISPEGGLRAAIAEVNNTFHESHSYVLAHEDGRLIEPDDVLLANKAFHVSPFLEIEGHYQFRFSIKPERATIVIDHVNDKGEVLLNTSLKMKASAYTRANLYSTFFTYPLFTLKVVLLIHYQALCLFLKKIRYIRKPKPPKATVTKGSSA